MREVKRQAKVGEYIKLVNPQYNFDKAGDILKVDYVSGSLVCVLGKNHKRDTDDDKCGWSYPKYTYVVLEDYKGEKSMEFNKDNLKVGDKVLLINERGTEWNPEGKMDKYKGKIVTISKLKDSCFEIKENDPKKDGFFSKWNFYYKDIERKVTNFTRDDLEFGDILTLRNEERYVHASEHIYGEDEDYHLDCDEISYYHTEKLKHEDDSDYDVVKVERVGQVVYEREEELKEMTLSQVCEQLGYDVKIVKEED